MASGLTANKKLRHKITAAALLVTLGVVYGDIGTSPLYVMKSIVAGNGGMGHFDTDFLVGSVSLIFWTLLIITTVKYVLIALRADNNGEGGILRCIRLFASVLVGWYCPPWLAVLLCWQMGC